jgi:hypothetical protein
MEKFINNLIAQAEENPVLALGVAAGLIGAVSKLLDANTSARNSKTWKREELRREMKDFAKKR